MLSRRTDLSTGEQQENKKALPLKSEDLREDKSELERLFDMQFGSLDNSSILSHEEYLNHRDFQIQSGFFAFRLTQFSGCSYTKTNLAHL